MALNKNLKYDIYQNEPVCASKLFHYNVFVVT